MIDHDEKIYVANKMTDYGGGFVQTLGMLIFKADYINLEKIKKAFPEYWEQYKNFGGD